MEIEVIDPPPVIELPGMQYAPDHSHAVDVTPPPYRPPMPPREPPRATPKGHNNADIPPHIHERALKQPENFHSDRYDPQDAPLRYPRRNRNGW
jgi:hypothetical protein